mmetsp:Transcript_43592/g.64033  ORF Transcript_43592/g.64033 Transcript_43592/m.64033 type:complete len:275 (+) Transcript_43592:109-933(+)
MQSLHLSLLAFTLLCKSDDKVPVTVHVINTLDGWPELLGTEVRHGIGGRVAAVRVIPLLSDDLLHGVRRIFEWVVKLVHLTLLDQTNLFPDCKHSIAETIKLSLALRLGGLEHEGACHRPRHGRCVQRVVTQAFCNVHGIDATRVLERTKIHDELVSNAAVLSCEKHFELSLEAGLHVIGVKDGELCCALQTPRAHHLDVHPRDRQDRCRTPGRSSNGTHSLRAAGLDNGVARKVGRQASNYTNGSHARATATVRDAEGLVQVEMAHVSAHVTR